MNLFKRKNIQPTIEYIEKKYKLKLTYPIQLIENVVDIKYYNELINFGCSDVFYDSNYIHKDCMCSGKWIYDIKTGKVIEKIKRKCDNCNYYPILKEYQDSIDIKKIRLKKLKKLNE